MGYVIETAIEKDYIKLVASGEQTLESNKELVFQVIEACTENNIRKVLVDISGTLGQPGTFSDFKLANIAAKEAFGLIQRVALVNRQENREFTSFFETAIRNRGINLLAFLDEQEAIKWLLES